MANPELVKFLSPDFHSCPPTDVRFWFKEQDSSIKEVNAHQVILACASDVFNREFFGSLKAESDVEIKDASQSAFLTMIEFIYNKQPNYKESDLSSLASLYYLGDKYNIRRLRKEILDSITEHEVTSGTALDVAILAENNILHEPLYDALYDAIIRFVKKAEDIETRFDRVMDLFAKENKEHAMVIFNIMERVKNIEKVKKTEKHDCRNCKKFPCIDGQRLNENNFTRGATVALASGTTRILNEVVGHEDFSAIRVGSGCGIIGRDFHFSSGYFYKCR